MTTNIQSTRGGSILESIDTKSLTDNILNTSERNFVNAGGDVIKGNLNFTENALINMNHNKIINLGEGINDNDAVNKKQLNKITEDYILSNKTRSTILVFKQQVANKLMDIENVNTKQIGRASCRERV